MSRPVEGEPLLTPAEVARKFGVDVRTLTRWAKAGKLTSIRTLGGHRRYFADEVEALRKPETTALPAEPATHCPDCLYPAGSRNHETACGTAS